MGNSSTKLAEKCSLLSKDEVPVVASSFKLVSKNSERIKEDDLMVSWAIEGITTIHILFNIISPCFIYCVFVAFAEILGFANGPATRSIYHEFSVWLAGQSVIGGGVPAIRRVVCVLCAGHRWRSYPCAIDEFGPHRKRYLRNCLSINQRGKCFVFVRQAMHFLCCNVTTFMVFLRSMWRRWSVVIWEHYA